MSNLFFVCFTISFLEMALFAAAPSNNIEALKKVIQYGIDINVFVKEIRKYAFGMLSPWLQIMIVLMY